MRQKVHGALMGLGALTFFACSHPAERALQGRWYGESVENFDETSLAAATGWARGTIIEIEGKRMKVTVPAQAPRTGVFELAAIEERRVKLNVLDSQGDSSEVDFIVDDTESIRWVLEEGRTVVLKKQP